MNKDITDRLVELSEDINWAKTYKGDGTPAGLKTIQDAIDEIKLLRKISTGCLSIYDSLTIASLETINNLTKFTSVIRSAMNDRKHI